MNVPGLPRRIPGVNLLPRQNISKYFSKENIFFKAFRKKNGILDIFVYSYWSMMVKALLQVILSMGKTCIFKLQKTSIAAKRTAIAPFTRNHLLLRPVVETAHDVVVVTSKLPSYVSYATKHKHYLTSHSSLLAIFCILQKCFQPFPACPFSSTFSFVLF